MKAKVLSIKKLDNVSDVYDITVKKNHNFFANSVLLHNSEQWLDPENVCNLGHANLAKFYEYGFETYKKIIRFGIYYGVSVIMNEIADNRSPTSLQKEKLIQMPRVGLGLTGLADYFIDNKIVYGSPESIEETSKLFKTLASVAYKTNGEIGRKKGSFPTYSRDKMKKSEYIQRLLANGLIDDEDLEYQYCVACTTIAPVGSGSIIANVGGSGIEPIFSKYYVRRERSTSSEWKEWFTYNAYVERYLKSRNIEVTKENVDNLTEPYWVTSFDIPALNKMALVSEAQKWIDSSISVTFNIPEQATVEDVKEIYMQAWKQGLKGITVYRDNSLTGVMITEKNYDKTLKEEKKKKTHDSSYEPRPEILDCDIYEMKYKDTKLIVLVGLKDGDPYEVFITPNNDGEIDVEKYKHGKIKKVKSGHYDLIVENGEVKTMINNISKTFDSVYGTLSRMVSMSLRSKVPLQFIVEQLNKDSGFIAFEKVLSRILKKYISDNTVTKKTCPECGSNLIYIDGCISCSNSSCGYSKCD